MTLDLCALPVREAPELDKPAPRQFIQADLGPAYERLARQKAAAAKLKEDWLTAHPGEEYPTRASRPIQPSPSLSDAAWTQQFMTQRDEGQLADLTEITDPTGASGTRDESSAASEVPPKQRPLTEHRAPLPPAQEPLALPTRTASSRGRGRGKTNGPTGAVPGRETMPATLGKMRERFPTLAHFVSHLSSTPRLVSNDTIELSEDDDSQSPDEHRNKRQKHEPTFTSLNGIRVFFISEDARIPATALTTVMKNLHERGAVVQERLVLHSEDRHCYTTHIVATQTGGKDWSMRRILKALDLESEAMLFGDSISRLPAMRRPLVVRQQWASDAIRHGKVAEDLYLIKTKQVLPQLEFHPPLLPVNGLNTDQPSSSISPQRVDTAGQKAPIAPVSNTEGMSAHSDDDDDGYVSEPIEEEADSYAGGQWDDLADELKRAAKGEGAEKDTSPRKYNGKEGFVIRRERKGSDSDTAGEEAAERRANAAKQSEHRQNRIREQEIWACQRKSVYGGSSVAHPANQRTVDVLGELAEEYDRVGDYWRLSTCRKVIGIVRNTTYVLNNFNVASRIRGIGDSMARKIVEIYSTGYLERLRRRTPVDRAAVIFARCHGIGPSEAGRFSRLGARGLKDLKPGNRFGIKLNRQQELGVQYYDDLRNRMPREEAGNIHAIIEKRGKQLDPVATFSIMGSYRRGQPDCGDIDILISRDTADGSDHAGLVRQLVEQLFKDGLLKHTLSAPEDWDSLDAKWNGLCSINGGRMRRIDFLGVPHDEMPAALIYFTGNDILAKDVIRDPSTKLKVTEGKIIKFKTEEEIFKFLGVKWRPPTERLP